MIAQMTEDLEVSGDLEAVDRFIFGSFKTITVKAAPAYDREYKEALWRLYQVGRRKV